MISSNSRTCLTPWERIIDNYLTFLSTSINSIYIELLMIPLSSSSLCGYLPTDRYIYYFECLCGHLSNLSCKLSSQRIVFTSRQCSTERVTKTYYRNKSLSFRRTVKFYGSKEAILCLFVQITLIRRFFGISVLKSSVDEILKVL
jgi:hypothetical protein